jgi:hypothetical protein
VDIVNPNQPTEEKQTSQELEIAALRKALEASQAGREQDRAKLEEWQFLFDERVSQESDLNAAVEAARLQDATPRAQARPDTWEEYISLPTTKARSEVIRLYGQAYVEQLQAKHITEQRRRRELGLDKLRMPKKK